MVTPAEQATQQAIIALRDELNLTRQALQQVQQDNNGLRQAQAALEQNTAAVLQAQMQQVTGMEERLKKTLHVQRMDLLNLKNYKPEGFTGKEGEAWNPWTKKVKLFLNGKAPGFRQALKWCEDCQAEIDPSVLARMPWDMKDAANEQLHELLLSNLDGRALQIVEAPGLEGRGFECWRQLKAEFEPSGGHWEVKVTTGLMNPSRAKDMPALSEAITKWQNRVIKWEARNAVKFPEIMKVPALMAMIPASYTAEIEWRFASDLSNFDTLVKAVKEYATHQRLSKFAKNDPDKMDIDALERAAFDRGVAECEEDEEYDPDTGDRGLDALYRNSYQKGRSKGKGKGGGSGYRSGKGAEGRGGGQGGGKGAGGPGGPGPSGGGGKGAGAETRTCHHCQKTGHLKKDCRDFLAGRPKAPRAATSLEYDPAYIAEGDEIRGLNGQSVGTLEREVYAIGYEELMGRECSPFDADLGINGGG